MPLRLLQQARDLIAREHTRQALGLARPAQLGGGIVLDHAFAAQMPVEGAQAGHLAPERGRRRRCRPFGELGQERRQIPMARLQGAHPAALEEGAELEEIRAVGLERVARQAPLELQIGEEVERQMLDPEPRRGCCDLLKAHPPRFASAAAAPWECNGSFRRSPASSPSTVPPASAAAKNSGSCVRLRPIVSAGSPLAA